MDLILGKIKTYIEKILTSPVLLSLLLCLTVLFFSFIIYKPQYNICDDYFMRSMADGTANPYVGPSNFLLYISSYYGEILKNLYIFNPNVYWYDFFFYIFLVLSLVTSALCIFKQNNLIFNIIAFLTLLFIYTPLFISVQFTIVSGMMAVSAIILAIYTINNKVSKAQLFLNSFLITLFITISCLIRYHAFFAVAILGFLYFLFFIKKESIKKIVYIILITLLAISINTALYQKWQINIKSDPATKHCLDFNKAQVALFNDTIAYDNIFFPYYPIEKKVKNLDKILKTANLTIGDYRLLLTWSYIGNDNILSNTNMNKVVENLSPKIQLKKNIRLKFALDDYRNVLRSYFLIMLCLFLMYPSVKTSRRGLIFTAIFVLYIIGLNIPFRTTPYRLWINFASLMPLVYLCYLKNNTKYFLLLKQKFNQYLNNNIYLALIILILIFLLYCFIGYRPIKKHATYNKQTINSVQKILKKNIPLLDKNKVYFPTIFLLESAAKPFKQNVFANNKHIMLSAPLHYPQTKNLYKYYEIPTTDSWDYLCSNDNYEILTIENGPYNDFYFTQLRLAVSKHMKDRYNKDVTFVKKQDYGKLKSYSCEVMTQEDLDFARKLKRAEHYNYLQDLEKNINYGDM